MYIFFRNPKKIKERSLRGLQAGVETCHFPNWYTNFVQTIFSVPNSLNFYPNSTLKPISKSNFCLLSLNSNLLFCIYFLLLTPILSFPHGDCNS